MPGNTVPYLIVMLICLLLSAFFSATETAFSSYNRTRVKTLAEKGKKRAKLVLHLSENYDKLISTILIGNNLVNIAIASLGTVLFVHYYGDIGATISTAVVTVTVLIFGEISPKSISKDFPESFSMFSAPIIRLLIWIFLPLNLLFSLWKKFLTLFFKPKDDDKMSQEELLMLVEEVQQDGSIDKEEGNLLKNAIEFSERKAEDILTHRVDLEAFPKDTPKEEIAKKFSDTKFSRLLVYEDSVDNIVGIVNQKDFYTENGITERSLDEILTPPLFIHQTEKISDLLRILQKNKSHIAVVLDEYGGTLGIVTMEDILEELVGEIWDEHDDVVELFREEADGSVLVDCSADPEDFFKRFSVDAATDSTTLAGWVSEMLDKVPQEGDTFEAFGLSVRVEQADAHRVLSVRVQRLREEVREPEQEEKRDLSEERSEKNPEEPN